MAKVKKTRKNVKTNRGNITLTKEKTPYAVESIDDLIKRASNLTKTYDDLLVNTYRKRVGTSEYNRLFRIITKNIENCCKDIKRALQNLKQKISCEERKRLIEVLAELNARLIKAPIDFNDACLFGRMIVAKSSMCTAESLWQEIKNLYNSILENLDGASFDEIEKAIQNVSAIIETNESEIDRAIKEARFLESLVSIKAQKIDEDLKHILMENGFRIPEGKLDKKALIDILSSKMSSINNVVLSTEYQIVVGTISAMKSQDDDFYDLLDILVNSMQDLEQLQTDLKNRIIFTQSSTVFIASDDTTLLSADLEHDETQHRTMESHDIETIETAKKNHMQAAIDAGTSASIIDKISTSIIKFRRAISSILGLPKNKLDDPGNKPKTFVNMPTKKD